MVVVLQFHSGVVLRDNGWKETSVRRTLKEKQWEDCFISGCWLDWIVRNLEGTQLESWWQSVSGKHVLMEYWWVQSAKSFVSPVNTPQRAMSADWISKFNFTNKLHKIIDSISNFSCPCLMGSQILYDGDNGSYI